MYKSSSDYPFDFCGFFALMRKNGNGSDHIMQSLPFFRFPAQARPSPESLLHKKITHSIEWVRITGLRTPFCAECLLYPRFPSAKLSIVPRRGTIEGSLAKNSFHNKNPLHGSGFLLWSGLRGSNPPPPPWQGGALPNELNPHRSDRMFTRPLQNGASGRNRTNDTRIFSPLLYQLSYRGKRQTRCLCRYILSMPIQLNGDPKGTRTPDL